MKCPLCGTETNEAICPICGSEVAQEAASSASPFSLAGEEKQESVQTESTGGFSLAGGQKVDGSAPAFASAAPKIADDFSDLDSTPVTVTNTNVSSYSQASYGSSKKSGVVGLIIGIIVMVAVVGAGLWFFVFRESPASECERIVKNYMNALNDGDGAALVKSVDPKAYKSSDLQSLESAFATLKATGVEYTISYKVTSNTAATDAEVKSACSVCYGDESVASQISSARVVKIDADITVNYLGQSQSQSSPMSFLCGKKDGNWYVISTSTY